MDSVGMSREASTSRRVGSAAPSPARTCGIVMPIAAMGDDYPEEHWRRVRKIFQRAVERAEMRPQLVWENPEVDVIQSAILQNLYENDVVICDVSGLNPNVMLEAGLRLSTKKPTIIVTDRRIKPPFDIGVVGYIDYQRDLEYNAIEAFIEKLSSKIISVRDAYDSGAYKSFVENFTFETVTPSTVNVSGEEYIKDQLETLVATVRRLEAQGTAPASTPPANRTPRRIRPIANIRAAVDAEKASEIEFELDQLSGFGISESKKVDDGEYLFTIPISHPSLLPVEEARRRISEVMNAHEVGNFKLYFT